MERGEWLGSRADGDWEILLYWALGCMGLGRGGPGSMGGGGVVDLRGFWFCATRAGCGRASALRWAVGVGGFFR